MQHSMPAVHLIDVLCRHLVSRRTQLSHYLQIAVQAGEAGDASCSWVKGGALHCQFTQVITALPCAQQQGLSAPDTSCDLTLLPASSNQLVAVSIPSQAVPSMKHTVGFPALILKHIPMPISLTQDI